MRRNFLLLLLGNPGDVLPAGLTHDEKKIAKGRAFSLSSLEGGEGRGEEASLFPVQIPSPQPSPRLGGEREFAVRYLSVASCCLFLLLVAGCASTPGKHFTPAANSFPADAFITQRGVLTVMGRQFTLNGYLASSATNGRRLIVTENFGNVLADVLLKPTGEAVVMRSSRIFKPAWIRDYVAADVRCLFGGGSATNCPGRQLSPTHFVIERRGYQLDLQIVAIKPGPQAAELFDAARATKP